MNATSFNMVEFNIVGWCWTACAVVRLCGCAVLTRILEIRDRARIMTPNFWPNYPLPLADSPCFLK